MKTVGDKLESFSVVGVKPGFNNHEENGQYPPEVCKLLDWQRYNFKLNPKQTSDMIKFAVTRPQTRAGHIKANIDQLGWGKDPYLREVGLKINENMESLTIFGKVLSKFLH